MGGGWVVAFPVLVLARTLELAVLVVAAAVVVAAAAVVGRVVLLLLAALVVCLFAGL